MPLPHLSNKVAPCGPPQGPKLWGSQVQESGRQLNLEENMTSFTWIRALKF